VADDALSIVERLSRVFEELGIVYLVGGSVASVRYGEIRSTNDVDFVATLGIPHATQLARRLEGAWYADVDSMAEAIRTLGSFNLIDFQTMLKADVFVAGRDEFTQSQLERRRRESLGPPEDPVEAFVASAEDIVLQKLRWYRMGGEVSDRQWRDVKGVLVYQSGSLDDAYMDRWATALGISDLLLRARADADRR
jgi:hypothetical protein